MIFGFQLKLKISLFSSQICDRIFIGEFQWNIHLKSTKHRRIEIRKKKMEAQK